MSDYTLWKMWWYAALYNAAPETRMAMLDRARAGKGVGE